MQEKFMESLEKAKRYLQTADHLAFVTFPLMKENRLLLKVLEELGNALVFAINSVLQYEYVYKRIHIYSSAKENFQTFREVAKRYGIGYDQMKKIEEILNLMEKHKKSPFEFVKDDKIVIMSHGFGTDILTTEKIKGFVIETKDVVRKINVSFNKENSVGL